MELLSIIPCSARGAARTVTGTVGYCHPAGTGTCQPQGGTRHRSTHGSLGSQRGQRRCSRTGTLQTAPAHVHFAPNTKNSYSSLKWPQNQGGSLRRAEGVTLSKPLLSSPSSGSTSRILCVGIPSLHCGMETKLTWTLQILQDEAHAHFYKKSPFPTFIPLIHGRKSLYRPVKQNL